MPLRKKKETPRSTQETERNCEFREIKLKAKMAIVWVFIAQMVEHCSANAEATDSNPDEAPKTFFFCGLLRNCLNCHSTAKVTYSFQNQSSGANYSCNKLVVKSC